MGPKYRVVAGVLMNTFFAVGQVTCGLIAWAVPGWRQLTLALYLPQLVTVLLYWPLAESVRWSLSKGRHGEAEATLRQIARVNNTQLSEKSLEALRENVEEEKKRQLIEAEQRKSEPWLIVQVFQHKPVLVRCLVSPVWWITTMFVYYGLSVNAVNLSGNKYLNYVYVAAIEIPGFWLAFLLLGVLGRRLLLLAAFWLCAACQLAFIFIPNGTLYIIL